MSKPCQLVRMPAYLAGLTLVLSGCSQPAVFTPQSQYCAFEMVPLVAATPTPRGGMTRSAESGAEPLSPFASKIDDGLASFEEMRPRGGGAPVILTLSGGGEEGAFGAGVLAGWQGAGRLPEFQTVTGISTGAILSTFAFVGNAQAAVGGYTIDHEKDLLMPLTTPKNGEITAKNALALIRHGAFGTLEPLRARLAQTIPPEMLREVARGWRASRKLFVGAVNLDTGNAYAFDMGEMADRFDREADPSAAQRWRDCYYGAIIASSSVPMAAPPAFIDNVMYIDGGARFGLFNDSVMQVRQARLAKAAEENDDSPAPVVPVTYAIINGTLELSGEPAACSGSDDAPCDRETAGKHAPWSILTIGLAAEQVLINQVYRFSADKVSATAGDCPGCFNFLRIESDWASHVIRLPDPDDDQPRERNCASWLAIDKRVDNPVEFHKRYMRCLISYGTQRAQAAGWGQ